MKQIKVQDSLLLSTKLKRPNPRKNYIPRHDLFARLERSAEAGVVYVMGGAGMGKTTLVSSFLQESGYSHTAWLSLDEANDHIVSFWHYFIAAVGPFLGEAREDILALLQTSADTARMELLLTHVINVLCSEQDYYVVIDDIHCISNPQLIDSIDYFLKAMPDNLHLFLLSREHPRFYLGEQAVSGQLLFIDGDQLRFTEAEGLQFLKETLRLDASDETLAQMNTFAEGWIGGLQLVAAAGGSYREGLRAVGGGITADYLTREIFNQRSETERRFLTLTGILSYVDEELSTALMPEADFQTMINTLMGRNLFIVCVDEERGIYRYHNILGEYLLQQFRTIPPPEQRVYWQCAARVLAERGEEEEGLRHLFAAHDYAGIRALLRKMKESVETWIYIDKLPLPELMPDINLAMQCLVYNIGSLQFARAHEIGRALETYYKDNEVLQGVYNLYPYINDTGAAMELPAPLSLEQVEGLGLSPVTESLLLIESANISLSQKRYQECDLFAQRALNKIRGANICMDYLGLSSRAQLMEETGRLNESLATYEQMETLLKSSTIMDILGYNYYVSSLGVYHKRMDQERALQALETIEQMLNNGSVPPFMVSMGYEYHVAEYALLFGNVGEGVDTVYRMAKGFFADNHLGLDRLLYSVHLIQTLSPSVAEQFMQEFRQQAEDQNTLVSQLLYASLLGAQEQFEPALGLTERVLAFSRSHQNRLRLVEANLLKIRLLITKGTVRDKEINDSLREALHYGYENAILQPFYLERSVITPLLETYFAAAADQLSDGEREYLQAALSFTARQPLRAKKEKGLLSDREHEVLFELAQGYTNPEIAERLSISLATVKTHIINIYGKLAVSSRVAAVEAARTRGLLL
ncbi:LuxR C-terminal-related transcriptional regulator [Paenibacillus sp. GCM10012306]|uniref:LuxR C-terminal-related transcriptional regulator n=1 Tax=Paenibacillus sp. GCM10012306 TaxID=3317342 RepID=UPI00361D53E8